MDKPANSEVPVSEEIGTVTPESTPKEVVVGTVLTMQWAFPNEAAAKVFATRLKGMKSKTSYLLNAQIDPLTAIDEGAEVQVAPEAPE